MRTFLTELSQKQTSPNPGSLVTPCATKMTEEIQVPKKLPGTGHEVIVDLETIHHSTPEFDTEPSTHETIKYLYSTVQDDIADRLKFASIVLTVTCPINAQTLGEAPYL